MAQGRHLFPTMSYDNVDSEFIRDEIASGDYYDLDHRQYVNDLVYVEWYAKGGLERIQAGRVCIRISYYRCLSRRLTAGLRTRVPVARQHSI
jgi:hypothetical protein